MIYLERKPIKRTNIRIAAGKSFYTLKRYCEWYLGRKKYARTYSNEELEYIVFKHSTPLIRKLQNVDMNFQYNKIINLKIAAKRLNKIVIKPKETFSYWKVIGKPTYKKGYKDGLVLCPNGSFTYGVGGGLCQMSNLIYWMALHTPLEVVERHRHSHDVFPDVNRTQPFGSGATCVYNYMDLQIYNGTKFKYQFIVNVSKENLEGEVRCTRPNLYKYEVYEKEHSMTKGLWGDYIRNNTIYRKLYNKMGEVIEDKYITENHAKMMYQPLIENPKPEE